MRKPPSLRNNNGALQLRVRIDGSDAFINRLGSRPAVLKTPTYPLEKGGELKPTKVGASDLDASCTHRVILVLLLHQIEMDQIQEVLNWVQDQEGSHKLLMEEAELLQHLQGVLGVRWEKGDAKGPCNGTETALRSQA